MKKNKELEKIGSKPITLKKGTKTVKNGHARLEAVKTIGIKKIPKK